MQENLEGLEKEVLAIIERADSLGQLEELRISYLGKKGKVTEVLHALKDVPSEQRPQVGAAIHALKNKIQELLEGKAAQVKEKESASLWEKERIDVTLPGTFVSQGKQHPLTQVLREIYDFFKSFGFEVIEGPELETDYYNFEALNIPAHHPARDLFDTLYLENGLLLRTHTSPVQIRFMENNKPPFRIIAPGRVYRRDQVDASHSPFFHQIEGLVVGPQIQFGHLKGILEAFLHRLFGQELKVRFLPSFFPFTEPSAEVGLQCIFCQGKGCGVCKQSGWLEILGCGMVHPRVLKGVSLDPEQWNGFAFGLGLDRIVMLKYGIPDMRLLFENHKLFLQQF